MLYLFDAIPLIQFLMPQFSLPLTRRRLARIRCLQECISCLCDRKPLPQCLCYVPLEVEYYSPQKTNIKLYTQPNNSSDVFKEIVCTTDTRLIVSGEELCNKQGKWLKVKKVIYFCQCFESIPKVNNLDIFVGLRHHLYIPSSIFIYR